MRDKDVPIDRTKHVIYTKKAKKCVLTLLCRCYSKKEASELWEKIQLKYAEFLEEEPALGGVKITVSIYDPILIFAWYVTADKKPPLEEIEKEVYDAFMGAFDTLGKIFDLNKKLDNRIANLAFKSANDTRVKEIKKFPGSFRMGYYTYDKDNGAVMYSFTQCPNAEFAKRHHLEHALPFMCNCDHLAMQKLHACLIREGTCVTSDHCDYCIVGDRNPLASRYDLVRNKDGLLVSVRKQEKK